MKLSIKNSIYQSIISNKWLDISYVNKKEVATRYYLGVKDIDVDSGIIYGDIFNPFKSNTVIEDGKKDTFIYLSGIKSASVLEHTYYETPKELQEKAHNDKKLGEFLEVVNFDNNILRYLSDCYRLDNDPFLKEVVMVDGIDTHTLPEKGKYELDDKQFAVILDKVFKKNKYEAEIINRYQTLAINKFSIDIGGKQYVVAYRTLSLNFKDKTLKIADKSSINKSFLLTEDSKPLRLGMYLDMDQEEFCETFDLHEEEYIKEISQNFRRGEIVNTRPTIFFLMRNSQHGVDEAFEAINQMDQENRLTIPLKAFFGRNKARSGTSREVNLVVFDRNKINIDQMRVVYNSMVNHVTYVKGPPGTGKTETIFNVLLSAYANDKTVLVCSNNNHPVNDIFKKMDEFLTIKKPYKTEEEKVIFPMIRLGNNIGMEDTILKLREILSFVSKHEKSKVKEELTEASKNRSLSGFEELRDLLMVYETRIDLQEKIATLLKIRNMTTVLQINQKLFEQVATYEKQLKGLTFVKDEDVIKYAVSASEDMDFKNYVYYSSLLKLKKLNGESFKELREIIAIEDLGEGVKQLNKWLKDNANMRRLLGVFPIVICTNLSCDKLGSPKPQFDLVIMDEAGQCNTASSLIPIVRGNDLLLVGDTNQLQPVTVIEQDINDDLMERYGIGPEYDYVRNSILSTMLRKDNNSKNILLSYHYRCGKLIANFVNHRFYGEQLKLLNGKVGELLYYDVKNTVNPSARNSYAQEAWQIANIIKENGYKDVGIVTPFVNQAALINEYLMKMGISDTVTAGTIHNLQGSEKSVIIMSAALSLKTSKKTMNWIKNNHELINVAVTRAKDKFIFIGDKEAIDALSGNEENDIKVLSDYVFKNGKWNPPHSDAIISYDFSNESKNEKDFFDTIKPYFNRRGSKFKIERNVPVKKAIDNIHPEDLKIIGKKEFDVVVKVAGGFLKNFYHTIVVFEIDGGEHIGSKKTAALDRQKEEICHRYGIKLIRIPNSAVKDYELIIRLFELVVKGVRNIENADTTISLFDEE